MFTYKIFPIIYGRNGKTPRYLFGPAYVNLRFGLPGNLYYIYEVKIRCLKNALVFFSFRFSSKSKSTLVIKQSNIRRSPKSPKPRFYRFIIRRSSILYYSSWFWKYQKRARVILYGSGWTSDRLYASTARLL